MIEIHTVALGVRSVFCLCVISAFVSLVVSHVCSLVLSSCFLVPAMCFPMFVCLCHVPSCCCPCLHPSPVPNLPRCLYYWFHLCPVNSPCLVHLCLSPLCGHMFVPLSSTRASLFSPCALPMFVCLCHVPSCCCPCLHPSPVPNLPGCVYHWFHLCPVNSRSGERRVGKEWR